jgi:5'-methylthioadenosine phosphorylase
MKIGIISGHKIPNLISNSEKINIETIYGDTSFEVSKMGNHEIFFLNRHGEKSNIPPHKINYLANIQAFFSSHVDCIFSIGTVGSMKNNIKPGDFVLPHDFTDFTKLRSQSFFDDKRVHIDMTDPYCISLRNLIIQSCKKIKNTNIHEKGIYLTTEGPRLETASEIKFFSQIGDVVGMTGSPEIVLAREKGICYATICIVCNMATGLQNRLIADEISQIYKEKEPLVSNLLKDTIESLTDKRNCNCKNVLQKASL